MEKNISPLAVIELIYMPLNQTLINFLLCIFLCDDDLRIFFHMAVHYKAVAGRKGNLCSSAQQLHGGFSGINRSHRFKR